MHSTKSARLGLLTMAVSAALLTGCADDVSDSEPTTEVAHAALAAKPKTVRVKPKDGAYFADISADGTGCPAGTWTATIAPDGKSFELAFDFYEIGLDPSVTRASANCAITMKLHSKGKQTFTVDSVSLTGYLFLNAVGMTASETVVYGFNGDTSGAGSSRTDFVGLYDDSFVVQSAPEPYRKKNSKCGKAHSLTASTEITLVNGPAPDYAYMNNSRADGTSSLSVRLSNKPCE